MITLTSPLYYEGKIAEKLGIDREDLRAIRKAEMKPDEDFGQPGREIVLSAPGLVKLLTFLRAKGVVIPDDADFTDCMLEGAASGEKKPSGAEPLEMSVVRRYPNDRLLLCRRPDGELVNVRVKTNENFRAEMKLRAAWVEAKNAYVMEGRCPRYPGRY